MGQKAAKKKGKAKVNSNATETSSTIVHEIIGKKYQSWKNWHNLRRKKTC
jgi:hypothetical protein